MKKLFIAAILAVAMIGSGCTRVETGYVGIYTAWNGEVSQQEKGVGWHQTVVGSIQHFVANDVTLALENLTPQTKDRSKLHDLDLTFTYRIDPSNIAEMVTRFKGRNLVTPSGDVYPSGAYVQNIVMTAVGDVIAKYDALEANENRNTIPSEISERAKVLLAKDGLADKIKVSQVFIKSLNVDPKIQESALRVITEQNNYDAKVLEVKTASQEAERMKMIASQGDSKYVNLLNAQANMQIAEAISKGKVNTIVVPYDFKGIINVK